MSVKNLSKPVVAFAKLTAAGATIFAVGWGIVTLQPKPEEPVAEAKADIFGFEFADKTDQQKFLDTLMQEGMEEPRAYDHNGNKMFFSTAVTGESPREVMARFQQGFVENGLNKQVHLSPTGLNFEPIGDVRNEAERTRQKALNDARMAYMDDYVGGMVPVVVNPDSIAMAGATMKGGSEDTIGMLEEVLEKLKAAPDHKMELGTTVKAMRYMDAVREGPHRTRISAVWSDEDYDVRKIANVGDDIGVDPDIPVCPGCRRLMHFKGETEKDFGNNAFDAGRQSVDQVLSFYKASLPGHGWQLSETADIIDRAEKAGLKPRGDAEFVQFARGGEFLTVMAWDDESGTGVHIARSN